MNHTQSYTINGCIFQEFLTLLGRPQRPDPADGVPESGKRDPKVQMPKTDNHKPI